MSIPAQGAVGAETMTANWRCPECGCHSYAHVQEQKGDGSFAPGPKIRCVNCKAVWMHKSTLASPRADSDERTAGEDDPDVAYQRGKEDGYSEGVLDAAARAGLTLEYGASSDPERHVPGPVEMLQRIAEHTDALSPATPAQPAGAVPDSLRALSEAATKGEWYAANGTDIRARGALGAPIGMTSPAGDGNGLNDRAFVIALANWFRILLASHPAGQSAVSGAAWIVTNGETGDDLRFRMWSGRAWVWTSSLSQAAHFARKGDARQILPDGDEHGERVEPAPDSTRTDQGGAEELREEVAYWRRDLSARIWAMTAHYKGALERGEGIRASEIGNDLRAALASFHDAQAKDWYERCDICGEHIRDGEPTAASEDVSGHARCVSEDGEGAVYPHGEEDLAAQVRAAQAALAEPWPDAALAARPAAPEAQGAERVRHVKRGTEYEVLHRGVPLQIAVGTGYSPTGNCLHEDDRLVIYQGSDGKLWAREEREFDDGRFEPASSGQGGR